MASSVRFQMRADRGTLRRFYLRRAWQAKLAHCYAGLCVVGLWLVWRAIAVPLLQEGIWLIWVFVVAACLLVLLFPARVLERLVRNELQRLAESSYRLSSRGISVRRGARRFFLGWPDVGRVEETDEYLLMMDGRGVLAIIIFKNCLEAPTLEAIRRAIPTGKIAMCSAAETQRRERNKIRARRVLAFLIDFAVCGALALVLPLQPAWTATFRGPCMVVLSGVIVFFLLGLMRPVLLPTLYLMVSTAVWGATIGKAVCRLRVVGGPGTDAGFGRRLLREGLKLVGILTVVGAVLSCIQVLFAGQAWYDRLCSTRVVAITPRVPGQIQSIDRPPLRSEGDG